MPVFFLKGSIPKRGFYTQNLHTVYTENPYLFKLNESITKRFTSLPVSDHFTAEKLI